MDNSKQQFSSKEEFIKGVSWLYEHDLDRFYFLEKLISSMVNNKPIIVGISLNSKIHTVTVRIGEYVHKEEFNTLDKAMVLVDLVRS